MPSSSAHSETPVANDPHERLRTLWSGLLGVFFSACILRFGNPAILDDPAVSVKGLIPLVSSEPPTNARHIGLALITLLGLILARRPARIPRWVIVLPLAWIGWQFVAAVHTVDAGLTRAALKHFIGCVACFYLGSHVLGAVQRLWPFWAGLLVGFVFCIGVGWDQHFRGLEAMRQYFYVYTLPKLESPPAELIKRIESRRIFGTFVYANAMAGCILLLLPALAAAVGGAIPGLPKRISQLLVGLLLAASAACLYWTGSKSGWLIAMVMIAVLVARLPMARKIKVGLAVMVLVLGASAFFLRFAGYFEKGATSVSARFDYWAAARTGFLDKPVFGHGPGTFGVVYRQLKPPEAEMAQLAHNDFLEQACDSGVVGLVTFATLWIGSVGFLYRSTMPPRLAFFVWLGLLGWVLQSFVEFGLYIPGSAWPAHALLGWLWADTRNRIDGRPSEPHAHPPL